MKAVTFQGVKDVKVKSVPDPVIKKDDDILVRITSTAICGSDLHLIHGMVPNTPEDYSYCSFPTSFLPLTGAWIKEM
jgi:S-(hydroxymethyl)glutathione dehydrogenase/alcohol dehydrogenase